MTAINELPEVDRKVVQVNEPNVNSAIFDTFRASSIVDLSLFLKLRADELCDHGEAVFMMVGGGSLGHDEMNLENPYGGQQIAFLKGSKGSIFNEAFENAYHDPKCSGFANEIKEAHLASFIPYFLRCEADVLESFDCVKDVLELSELKWENCAINSGSSEKLADFIWSIHGHALEKSINTVLMTPEISNGTSKQSRVDMDILKTKIITALKSHINNITKRDFPDGNIAASYMYMVVRRKPREFL